MIETCRNPQYMASTALKNSPSKKVSGTAKNVVGQNFKAFENSTNEKLQLVGIGY